MNEDDECTCECLDCWGGVHDGEHPGCPVKRLRK